MTDRPTAIVSLKQRIRFEFEPDTFDAIFTREDQRRAFDAAFPDLPANRRNLAHEMIFLLNVTRHIAFQLHGDEAPAFMRFVEWWKDRDGKDIESLWKEYTRIPTDIIILWRTKAGQPDILYGASVEDLPESALNEEQREALKDKNSPLASNGARLPLKP